MQVYLESDVWRDLSGTASEIDNCLNDLTDTASESYGDIAECEVLDSHLQSFS